MKKNILIIAMLSILALVTAGCTPVSPTVCAINDTNCTANISIDNLSLSVGIADDTNASTMSQDGQDATIPMTPLPQDKGGMVDVTGAALPTKVVTEGATISLQENLAYDPDGDDIQYSFDAPFGADGTWKTSIGDAGTYVVNITATDGDLSSVLTVRVIVEPKDRPPVITNFADVTIAEGETLRLAPVITDPENGDIESDISGWMDGFTKRIGYDEAGTHVVRLYASDGVNVVERSITVTVRDVNRAPTILDLGTVNAKEGEMITLSPTASDPDGDPVTFQFGAPFSAQGTWQTSQGDAGTYETMVTVSDGTTSIEREITVVVTPLNHAPELSIDGSITVDEGETVVLEPVVSDADNDEVRIAYSGWMSTASRTTSYADAGTYTVVVTATDGKETVSKEVTITVVNKNRPPVFVDDIFG